ncbi:hypothetical protein IQ227_18415 [Anabaena aphanizomenioides LEGE 00250]|jgi:hypothetical protein|uniref:Uncharacterized protein n=1 Tax=Sphaerospermopsis aphanizomenoides LEGE 00250 TaxID=2777972 RepID=A0ABR9VHI8_9CYAN|nr:hypothetical protein [Sphaerospermopsis aphanizomenoides]MBE9237949.1 hypothetical protein [Sphaerospermopsis aphanizomenoides LEGE 00250]
MNCSEIYNVTSNRCKFAQKNDSQCNCEKVSVSKYSPGIIKNDEILIRQIYAPIHIDQETGKVNSLAFDDASDKGMSVNRKTYTSLEELNKKVEYKLKLDQERGKDRNFQGVIYTTCENIRSIKTNDNLKAFCVYDTGNKHDISHADICQTISSRVEGSKMRLKLRKAFTEKPITLDVVFTTSNN